MNVNAQKFISRWTVLLNFNSSRIFAGEAERTKAKEATSGSDPSGGEGGLRPAQLEKRAG
jgi:hypothetical protein